MLENAANNNLLNTHIGAQAQSASTTASRQKTTVNKYYNPLTQRMEEVVLPEINLEFNSPIDPESTNFSRAT